MSATTSTPSSNVNSATSALDAGTAPNADPAVQKAMTQMSQAFDLAITTNAEITSLKTALGAIETAAQQRPNIG